MGEIIDLYSKFLMAFVGVVTPVISLFLNNYLIDWTRFDKVFKSQQVITKKLINDEFKIAASSQDNIEGIDFVRSSYEKLKTREKKLNQWKYIVDKLNPGNFFKTNLKLLISAVFFLFLMVFIRTCKIIPYDHKYFQLFQLSAFGISAIFTLSHIFKLINMGNYLIEVRPIVDEINEYIKEDKDNSSSVLSSANTERPKDSNEVIAAKPAKIKRN